MYCHEFILSKIRPLKTEKQERFRIFSNKNRDVSEFFLKSRANARPLISRIIKSEQQFGPKGIRTPDLLRDREACFPLHYGSQCQGRELNSRPLAYETSATTTELPWQNIDNAFCCGTPSCTEATRFLIITHCFQREWTIPSPPSMPIEFCNNSLFLSFTSEMF